MPVIISSLKILSFELQLRSVANLSIESDRGLPLIVDNNSDLMKVQAILLVFWLIAVSQAGLSCTSSTCLASPHTYCPSGFCQCQSGFIFNCSTSASQLPTSATSITLTSNVPSYFILQSQVGSTLEYQITMKDLANSDMNSVYQIQAYIDNGIGENTIYPSGQIFVLTNQLRINLKVELTTQDGIDLPQLLILKITYTGAGTATVTTEYSYSTYSNSNILLILGYATGGLLLITTFVFMFLVYRKRRIQQRQHPQNRSNEEDEKCDISHFNVLMPASYISNRNKLQGKTCSVCLVEFEVTSQIRYTPCGHMFHIECIDQWCLKNLSCPLCRTDLSSNNIMSLKLQKAKQDDSSWIVNSLAGEEDPPEDNLQSRRSIREPLNNTSIDNSQL